MASTDKALEKVAERASEKGQDLVEKAKRLAMTAQIKGKIGTEEEVLQNMFTELGKQYYIYTKAPLDPRLKPHFAAIEKCLKKLEEFRRELREINGQMLCPHCKAIIAKDAPFCSICGKRIGQKPALNAQKKVCYLCGTVVEKDAQICTGCGACLKW